MKLTREEASRMARDAYAESKSYFDASIRAKIEADMRQFQGLHPVGSKYINDTYRGRSRLFRPKTRAMVRKNEAIAAEALFSTADVVTVRPFDDADEVAKLAGDIIQPILQHRLQNTIPWFLLSIGAYQDAQVTGVVISHQYWRMDKKKNIDTPVCKLVPVENFRVAPGAEWDDPIATSPYLIHEIPMFVGRIKQRMAKEGETLDGDEKKWIYYSDAELNSAVTSSSDSTRLTREGGRMDSKEQPSAVHDFTTVWVRRVIIELDGDDYEFYTLGSDQKLLSEPRLLSEICPYGRPYVMGMSALEAHKTYSDGPVHMIRDVQAESNEIANQRIDNIKFAMNKRYFVARTRQVDLRSLTRNVPSSVTMMNDPEKDVKIVETQDVTASAYAEQDRLNVEMDDLSGTFSGSSVQSNRKLNETVGGMNILTSNANQVAGYQLRTFVETWIEPVLNQLVEMIKLYEDDQSLLRLSPEGRAYLDKGGNVDKLFSNSVRVKVNVGMGATNPQDQVSNFMSGISALRAALADDVLTKYGLDAQEVIKEVFGKLGYSNGARFFHNESEQDPRIAQMQQQVQALQSALDSKHPPELLRGMVDKLAAETMAIKSKDVDQRVSAVYSAIQAGQVIAAVPDVAPVADSVLQSAGFTPGDGEDINLPQPVGPAPGSTIDNVSNKRTGIGFEQGGNTHPETPAPIPQPTGPDAGMKAGIETPRVDGVQE
jgi:hypothetical protein